MITICDVESNEGSLWHKQIHIYLFMTDNNAGENLASRQCWVLELELGGVGKGRRGRERERARTVHLYFGSGTVLETENTNFQPKTAESM